MQAVKGEGKGEDVQWKAMEASVSPKTMPGADQIMILRRPMMSMYLSAKRVKMKLVPETIRPTAMGLSKPISLNSVAEL